MRLAFTTYRVDRLKSLRAFFPDGTERRGIYVLQFNDGEAYVGQATDVCSRFLAHRRTYPDLVGVHFAPVPATTDAAGLNLLEQQQIRTEAARTTLRNVRHYQGRLHGPSALDPVVPTDHQLLFLQNGEVDEDVAHREVTEEQRAAGQKAFVRLSKDPSVEEVITLGALYLVLTLPCPRATERRFWAVSAAPTTNGGDRLLCFSINTPETFVIFKSGEDDIQAFLNVSRTMLVDAYGSLDEFTAAHDWLLVEEDAGYEACGGDAVRVRVHTAEDLFRLLSADENEGIRRAAAALNLMLMRKGPTMQARWHNVPLADHMFDWLDQLD